MNNSNLFTNNNLLEIPQKIFKKLIKFIADLRLAIILLLLLAIFSISGTIIEQGESVAFYQANYPEKPALFGFLTGKFINFVGLDHVYSTGWFLALMLLFGTSLITCTFTRQFPALKAAQNWNFYDKSRKFEKLAFSMELEKGSLNSLIPLLQKKGYKIFQEKDSLYARKGIIGKIGPIIVHSGMIIILLGAIWGLFTGFKAQEMVESGKTFQIKNIFEAGIFADSHIPKDWQVKVNRFWIDYTPDGVIDQFYSDLSVLDLEGKELDRKTIFVNEPLRYDGVTLYQTSWGISSVKVQLNNDEIIKRPMALLPIKNGEKLWGTFVSTNQDSTDGFILITKDLQGTLFIYNKEGNLISAVRQGMTTEINGIQLRIHELLGSTGLQIKADPGVPIVYTGFALLMLGVVMSYVSHSQIWALQEGDRFYFGGKTNRAQVVFEQELIAIIEEI